MRPRIFLAATAIATLAGGTAFAQCDQRLQEMQGAYGDFFMSGNVGFDQGRPVLRDLRDAALRMQEQGLEDACRQVVDAMETAVAAYQSYGETAGTTPIGSAGTTAGAAATTTTGTTGTVGTTTGTTTGTTAGTAVVPPEAATEAGTTGAATTGMRRPVVGDFTPEQVQARAMPLAQSDIPLNTSELQNRDVYSFNGEDIGDFEGMLISQGEPSHVIVSHGGFFNIGDNDVAIPLDLVNWDPEWQTFVVPFTEEQLDQAPDYDRSAEWDWTGNDRYWGQFRG